MTEFGLQDLPAEFYLGSTTAPAGKSFRSGLTIFWLMELAANRKGSLKWLPFLLP
jgi:hypothetical protein